MLKYIKAAFTNHWNLLAMMAGVGIAVIGGHPDVVLPLVLAAETAYLTIVGGNPKFQRYVDTQQHQQLTESRSQNNERLMRKMLRSLPRPLRERYYQLQERCRDLQSIASDLKQHGENRIDHSLESLQTESLDRLLWIYLKLLFTYHSLQKFLGQTSIQRINSDIQRIESRLQSIDENDSSSHAQKMRRTLQDNLVTSRDRAENYQRALANHEFVELEIDRLENKIKSLSEIAVNRQEPDYVSSQVDQVANSMLATERTMNDLNVFTGLGMDDDAPPRLVTDRQQH